MNEMKYCVCPVCGALPCDWSDNPGSLDSAIAVLKDAVSLYGKPGGPWSVPSDPGSWIARANNVLAEAKARTA